MRKEAGSVPDLLFGCSKRMAVVCVKGGKWGEDPFLGHEVGEKEKKGKILVEMREKIGYNNSVRKR